MTSKNKFKRLIQVHRGLKRVGLLLLILAIKKG